MRANRPSIGAFSHEGGGGGSSSYPTHPCSTLPDRPHRPDLRNGRVFAGSREACSLARRTEFHVDSLRATQVADNSGTSELLLRLQERWTVTGWSPFEQSAMSMHYLMESIRSQATMLAFKDSFLVASLVFIITALAALSLKKLEHDKTA